MKNTRVKARLKNHATADGVIRDTVIINGDTNYLCEFIDTVDKTKVLLIIHCTDIVEVLS